MQSTYGIATITGTTATVITGAHVSGQNWPLIPVLQAEDGSFIGTVSTNETSFMVAFDQTGSVRWTVADEWPQMATADGGVIGHSGITYDSEGTITGQANLFILEGDPGLNVSGHRPHNVGSLFHLAAETEQDHLAGLGNLAGNPVRVSSVQEFATQLISNDPLLVALSISDTARRFPIPTVPGVRRYHRENSLARIQTSPL